MKKLIERMIQSRNPAFRFDPALKDREIIYFFLQQLRALLRGCRLLFYAKSPKFMLLGKNVQFTYLQHINWGKFLKLGDFVYISGLGKGGISIGNNVGIGAFSRLVVGTSLNNMGHHIRIGNNVGIGEFAYLGGGGGLDIGHDCIIGQYFSCHPENHLYDNADVPIRLQGVTRKGIKVGANCWIGSKVTLLDGISIGSGCVIAAGAVVTRSFPPNSIIGGIPARLIRQTTQLEDEEIAPFTHAN